MQLDHCKDMSVHISTCTSYEFNTLIPGTGAVALIRCMFLYLITKMSDQVLEQ
jgi:hypothetical protein